MAGKIYSYTVLLRIGRDGRKRLSYDRFDRPVQIPINYIYRGAQILSRNGNFAKGYLRTIRVQDRFK